MILGTSILFSWLPTWPPLTFWKYTSNYYPHCNTSTVNRERCQWQPIDTLHRITIKIQYLTKYSSLLCTVLATDFTSIIWRVSDKALSGATVGAYIVRCSHCMRYHLNGLRSTFLILVLKYFQVIQQHLLLQYEHLNWFTCPTDNSSCTNICITAVLHSISSSLLWNQHRKKHQNFRNHTTAGMTSSCIIFGQWFQIVKFVDSPGWLITVKLLRFQESNKFPFHCYSVPTDESLYVLH